MEHQDPMFEEETTANQVKLWIQENLRILVSVFIVAAIALGIYSYSERTEPTIALSDEEMLLDANGEEEFTTSDETESTPVVTNGMKTKEVAPVSTELSRETEASFVEQAEAGDGTTHLARRALAHYLEKNTDSSLTGEHKVYIEDYLRKNISGHDVVTPTTSIEFSKDLIRQAIDQSKSLNNAQLENLKKYSARVSAYR